MTRDGERWCAQGQENGGWTIQLCVSSLSEQGDPCLHYLELIIYHITAAVSCSSELKCSTIEQCLV